MDYVAFGRAYFRATGLLVTVLHHFKPVYSSLAEMLGYQVQGKWLEFPTDASPCLCGLSGDSLYGLVAVTGNDWIFVLGPVFTVPLSSQVLNKTLEMLDIPLDYREKLYECMCQTTITSPGQLAKHLSLLYLTLNGVEISPGIICHDSKVQLPANPDVDYRMKVLENQEIHNSYVYEVTMYQMVREGNVEKLNQFFHDHEDMKINEGHMALSPLRHAKNIFITATSRVGFIGAIPGGMDMEKAYQLMDDYIRRCEQMVNLEDVTRLQYAMVLDFCRRTGESKRPDKISTDVWQCMNYIRSQVYHLVTLEDLATQLGRSTSYVRKHFQKEVGMTVGEFIINSKLEEAKSLLIYSAKTLAEISCDLCFSSQSYFHQLFKKAYGITPMQYRRQGQTI